MEHYWDRDALFGRGAWFVEEDALAVIAPLFSNYAVMRWLAEQAVWEQQEAAAQEEAQRRREEERPRQEAERGHRASQTSLLVDYHDAFTLLRLPESAPVRRISAAYHHLALKHHPDLGGTHQMMVALNRAFVLAREYAQAHQAA